MTTAPAAWIQRAIVYGVIPHAFGEPGFASVEARLDDLRDLGISALWLSPITRTLPKNFGYAVIDYFGTRPDYGTKEELRALVEAAHARGIRVLLDVVPNHSSSQHPYYQHAETNGPASPYFNFYDRDEQGKATYYFNWKHLPSLNFANPEVRAFVTEALAFWVREFDVDGFRVDAAWGIRQRWPQFWAECNAELKRLKPDALLIAEASARDPYYLQYGFDAAYDWTGELGHWAWNEIFENGLPVAEGVTKSICQVAAEDEPQPLVFRFLNNNDTGPRFITKYGVDFYRVAVAMLLTLPGLPCIYTGDEVGAEFHPYDNPTVDWNDRHRLRDHVHRLIALRTTHASLHSRRWRPLPCNPAPELFAYLRYAEEAEQPILVLLNFSDRQIEATLSLPSELAAFARTSESLDLFAGELVNIDAGDSVSISMPAWGIRVLMAPETVLINASSA